MVCFLAMPMPTPPDDLARHRLSDLEDRWAHTQRVAATAVEVATTVAAVDRECLVSAAWLHDIGYAPVLQRTGFHPIDGAQHLERLGWPFRVVALVAHHSCARFEASVRGLSVDLQRWPLEDSPVMDALVYADMTSGPRGERMCFTERIDEILMRYDPDSAVYRSITEARSLLAGHVDRVERKLASC